ncbi:MAG: hypothetical protein AB1757_29865 [Acidobacteriota bacterium]
MARKRSRKIAECAYCGEIKEITRDHVIPVCLFKLPYPKNLITVPACHECNHAKSKNDDYLRDLITTDIYGNQSPIAREIFENKVVRSSQNNRSLMAREFLSKVRIEPFHTKGGIYLGDFPSAPVDPEKIKTIFATIVRGLFYDHRRQRIPDNYVFEVLRYHPWDFKDVWESLGQMHPNGPRVLEGVFGCKYISATEDPPTTLWLLWFYGTFFISVSAMNPELIEERTVDKKQK